MENLKLEQQRAGRSAEFPQLALGSGIGRLMSAPMSKISIPSPGFSQVARKWVQS
jgi:hypothetical protein